MATQRRTQVKTNFLQIETPVRNTLTRILETLNQRRCHGVGIKADFFEDFSDNGSSYFLQKQKS